MSKQKAPAWAGFPGGAALALALYIALQCLLALLTIKGVLPEPMIFQAQVVCGGLAACCGGVLASRHMPSVGTLWAALGSTAIFAAAVLLCGFLVCDGVLWSEKTVSLLAGMAAGGVLAGLLGGRGGRRKQKKRDVRGAKKRS